jgi:predicted Zn-dependent protease
MLLCMAPRQKTSRWTAVTAAVALAIAPISPALAEPQKGPPIIRDTEAEQLLREYTRPILRAAGLEKQNIQVVILNEKVFNAFVADGRRIFINYGALMQAETPNQTIGVLAHETGHLAGGHLSKLREQLAQAQTQMNHCHAAWRRRDGGGARSGNSNSGLANAGAAAIAGPQEMIRRTVISYVRQQEENADRAGVRFLTATGQSAKGMYETFRRFTNESLFAARDADPYLQSHPMPAERVAALEELARSSPYWDKKDDPALQLRHDMVRAKVSAFMERQDTVYRRYPPSNDGLPARYARAIATYLHGDLRSALAQIDGLIQVQPNNPYFHELRGQALLEAASRPKRSLPCAKRCSSRIAHRSSRCYLGKRWWQPIIRPTPTKQLRFCVRRWRERPRRRSAIPSSRWPMAERGISRRPIWLPHRPPSFAATIRPRANWPRAQKPVSQSARPDGSRPMTSSAPSRCPAKRVTRNKLSRSTKFFGHRLSPRGLANAFASPARSRIVRARTLRHAAFRIGAEFFRWPARRYRDHRQELSAGASRVLEEAMAELSKRQTAAEARETEGERRHQRRDDL